jgi:hypothetical protein
LREIGKRLRISDEVLWSAMRRRIAFNAGASPSQFEKEKSLLSGIARAIPLSLKSMGGRPKIAASYE